MDVVTIDEITKFSMNSDMLSELQDKILGNRKEDFTNEELSELFDQRINPVFNVILLTALKTKVISTDNAMMQIIPKARNNNFLIPFALLLRYGANPNMYINLPTVGTVHILGYLYVVLEEKADTQTFNTLLLLLKLRGSNVGMPMFDSSAGTIRRDEAGKISNKKSVLEWLNQHYNDVILNKIATNAINDVVSDETMITLAILLDEPELAPTKITQQKYRDIIMSYSDSFMKVIRVPEIRDRMDYLSLKYSVYFLNVSTYNAFLMRGILPSYIMINTLILYMRFYYQANNIIPMSILLDMLIFSISDGVQLDPHQYKMLEGLPANIVEEIREAYDNPYWRKVCNNTKHKETPQKILQLASTLNVDVSLSLGSICDNIQAISQADPEALKEAAVKRQKLKMASELGSNSEFIGDTVPSMVCRNRSLMPNDVMEYSDINVAYYRDDQGAIWCYTSDRFAEMISSGRNPDNMTELPISFINQLKYQSEMLELLGLSTDKVKTYSQSLELLSEKDNLTALNEDQLKQPLMKMVTIANACGVEGTRIMSLTKVEMMQVLSGINYTADLAPLTLEHSLITFAHIVIYLDSLDNSSHLKKLMTSLSPGGVYTPRQIKIPAQTRRPIKYN